MQMFRRHNRRSMFKWTNPDLLRPQPVVNPRFKQLATSPATPSRSSRSSKALIPCRITTQVTFNSSSRCPNNSVRVATWHRANAKIPRLKEIRCRKWIINLKEAQTSKIRSRSNNKFQTPPFRIELLNRSEVQISVNYSRIMVCNPALAKVNSRKAITPNKTSMAR